MTVSSTVSGRGHANGRKRGTFITLAVMCWLSISEAVPVLRNSKGPAFGKIDAMAYLEKYGYMNEAGIGDSNKSKSMGFLRTPQSFHDALKAFQAFSGLPVTGELDAATVSLMKSPRCGVRDIDPQRSSRNKRYSFQGGRWSSRQLTYRVSSYPSRPAPSAVDGEVQRAFALWQQHAGLRFQEASAWEEPDIEIRFESYEHYGCNEDFDGRGNVLGHAFYPAFGGDIHLDADELWTIGQYRGTNLFQTVAHEIGHSLGLGHSDVPEALMRSFSSPYDPDFAIHEDDIAGIQELYGPPLGDSQEQQTKEDEGQEKGEEDEEEEEKELEGEEDEEEEEKELEEEETTIAVTHVPISDSTAHPLCNDSKVDTMFTDAEGNIYAFKGEHYYKLSDDGVEKGYPKPIFESWPGLPGQLDASFTYLNGKTYFFKGELYWRYDGRVLDGDFPQLIADHFMGIPDDVDAAMMWPANGKVYFFKGDEFWKYDPARTPPVSEIYPMPISVWDGVPDNLNAVLIHDGYTYFFKDQQYYRFDDYAFTVDSGNPSFPRPINRWWFGCGRSVRVSVGKER